MKLTDCINFLLTNSQNTVYTYFKKELQQHNVTPIQYALLKCLWDEDQQTPTQLAQQLRLDTSTVTGIMARLEDKNLIIRNYSTIDRRRTIVCLTEEGRKLQAPIEKLIADANVAVTVDLSPEEVAYFKQLLQKISQNASSLLN